MPSTLQENGLQAVRCKLKPVLLQELTRDLLAAMPIVFVYGTLKRGDCRHRSLAGSKFLGLATTENGYRLFHMGEYPAMVEDSHGGQIEGELFEVSEATLRVLDEVEGVADVLYTRHPVRLINPVEGAEAYVYLGSVVGKRELSRRWIVPPQKTL